MNLKTVIGAITLACVGVSSTPAFAQQAGAQQPQGWMWGFGVAASQDVYTDFDKTFIIVVDVYYLYLILLSYLLSVEGQYLYILSHVSLMYIYIYIVCSK